MTTSRSHDHTPEQPRPLWYVETPEGGVRPASMQEAEQLYRDRWQERRVGWNSDGVTDVSTVFLGLDHNHSGEGPPVLFETMAFRTDMTTGKHDEIHQQRYSTREQALAGHAEVCALLLAGANGGTPADIKAMQDLLAARRHNKKEN